MKMSIFTMSNKLQKLNTVAGTTLKDKPSKPSKPE